MNTLTPLIRPNQSQIKIEPTPKECPSDGFNYPSFRLLNKHTRISLSGPINPEPSTQYGLLAISNTKGWFVAVKSNNSSFELIFSTLDELRSTCKAVKEGGENLLHPKRTLPVLQGRPNIVVFASHDTRLLVGLETGLVLVYDTQALLCPGSEIVAPLVISQLQSSPLRQILPNPGTESSLADVVAILGDGMVQLLDMGLQLQGGWVTDGSSPNPMAVSWSPKGKHLAIGLQTGDILTYSLANKSTPHKHVPPTADANLVSLNWLGPGHTFRTSYSSSTGPSHHIITLDTKSPSAVYYALTHPFTISDRPFQSAYTLFLPRWDGDAANVDDTKSLLIVCDRSSVDLEVVANSGSQWYQQSQDNPVNLPLDKSMEDTMLLALDVDLTDSSTSAPIMYAYLNDGTLQGWYMDSSKSYPLMVTPLIPGAVMGQVSQSQESDFGQTDASMSTEENLAVKPVSSGFGQTSASTLGPPAAFGQKPSSAFAQPSAFGQSSSAFAQSPSQASPAFGQTSFGAFSGFGTKAETAGPSFSGSSNPTPSSSFGGYGSGPSVFGLRDTSSFGQVSSGSKDSLTAGVSGSAPSVSREASMSDSTPSFGGLSLGSANSGSNAKPGSGVFGSFSTHPASQSDAQTTPGFGGAVKPAVGFGAFSNLQSANIPNAEKPVAPISAFGSSSSSGSSPAFGQSGFGQSGFGQSGFGQPGFGQVSKPSLSYAPSIPGKGFSAFASATPTAFASATQPGKDSGSGGAFAPLPAGGGFSAFASNTPTSFGAAPNAAASLSAPSSEKPASPFGNNTPAFSTSTFGSGNAFTTPSASAPAAGSTLKSLFGSGPPSQAAASVALSNSTKAPTSSPDLSPEPPSNDRSPLVVDDSPPPPLAFKSSAPAPTSGAFAGIKTSPAAFRPASGFGAFGSDSTPKTSPFFKNPDETKPAPVSVFANLNPATRPSTTPATPSGSAPTFGSPSLIGGANKSTFAPPTPPSPTPAKVTGSGGFGAFSGTPFGFSGFAGPKKSFSDLLKTGDNDLKDAAQPEEAVAASDTPSISDLSRGIPSSLASSNKTKDDLAPAITPASIFSSISKDGKQQEISEEIAVPGTLEDSEKTTVEYEEKTPQPSSSSETISKEPSLGNISSAGSSFVEVSADTSGEMTSHIQENVEEDVQDGDDDNGSFLSESFGSSSDSSYVDDGDSEEEGSEVGFEHSPSPVPTTVPLPESRSPSATPQPEVPDIEVTPSPPAVHGDGPALRDARASSTTPPGTPVNETKPLLSSSSASMASQTPFGLGIGKPSTRPTRSSPLASAPMSGNDDDDEQQTAPKPPVSPKPVFGVLQVTSDHLSADSNSDGQPSSKRPKTPPLLSSFGSIKATPTSDKSRVATTTLPVTSAPVFASAVPPARPAISRPLASPSSPNLFEKSSLFGPQDGGIVRPASTPAVFGTSPSVTSTTSPSSLPAYKGFNVSPFDPPSGQSALQGAFGAHVLPASSNLFNNLFGSKVTPESQAPQMKSFSPSIFDTQGHTPPKKPGHTLFSGQASPQTPNLFGPNAHVSASSSPTPVSPPKPPVQSDIAKMEEGMQKECALLVNTIHKELEEFRIRAQAVTQKRAELSKPAGGLRKKSDLSDPAKWSLGDAGQFSQVLLQYQEDLFHLKELKEQDRQALRELQSNMLKAGTRREEIVRFNKAKNDSDFSKMLRARTLGPEHSETQTQLRRNIRAMRDRIQKLESHLQASKKKLSESSSGKLGFRAPSLDTINRTYRNIDIAIQQQANDVAKLGARIAQLDLEDKLHVPDTRDNRLPDSISRRPYNVTPNVAVTTAAALNAERSAQRLKRALLSVRKEPLLNNMATTASPPPIVFKTPQKVSSSAMFAFQTPLSGALFSPPYTLHTPSGDWTLPEDNFNPSPKLPGRRGAGCGTKKHSSVPLKRTPGFSPTPTATFDWGPLPTFNNSPPTTLAANIPKLSTGLFSQKS